MVDLNMDFARSLAIDTQQMGWAPSPRNGVERRRLEREMAESGRATTIVRYAPQASFSRHTHSGGEEYLVLQGAFSDENGDFATGTYVRNPPGTSHAPFSADGCTIFVKLSQMKPHGEPQIAVDTRTEPWQEGLIDGHEIMPLYRGGDEVVTLEKLAPGCELGARAQPGGEEILVIEGTLEVDGERHGRQTWIRHPAGTTSRLGSTEGCTVWIKRGHLGGHTV